LTSRAIEAFFSNPSPDDILLLAFSGHRIKDDDSRLYLAVANTYPRLLRSTYIPSNLITAAMRRSQSRRQQSIRFSEVFILAFRDLSQNIGLEIQKAGHLQFLLDLRDPSRSS
jgi:hypothetical protein